MGNSNLYEWQAEALLQPGVMDGRNLVYCAPTSGGKSLVAEILALKRLYATGKAALLVLPFVSLCSEKAAHWEKILEPLGYRVRLLLACCGRPLCFGQYIQTGQLVPSAACFPCSRSIYI
jgi:replicative superfamily II helicase